MELVSDGGQVVLDDAVLAESDDGHGVGHEARLSDTGDLSVSITPSVLTRNLTLCCRDKK